MGVTAPETAQAALTKCLSEKAKLLDKDGNPVETESIWKDKPVVVFVVRRPGCILCRAVAKKIAEIKPQLEGMGVDLVAVMHQWLPAEIEAFLDGYWDSPAYKDVDKMFYKTVGGGKVNKGSLFHLFHGDVRQRGKEAKELVKDSNLKGDGLKLGGILVIKKGGSVAAAFAEEKFGEHPPMTEVLDAAKSALVA